MVRTTRTTGRLHFEDLDPKRFEDLVRQLLYEFRVWRKLEATGRAGSDNGFDARATEIVPERDGDVNNHVDVSGEQSAEAADTPVDNNTDRLWLVQCKRERQIGPAKLVTYLDDIKLQTGENLHGLIFAAACGFSKKTHDVFNEKCRALGIQEFYLRGKGAIEDLLYQPRNDHLLFAYFGFLLTIQRRTLQATLRRDIATKKRLKTITKDSA